MKFEVEEICVDVINNVNEIDNIKVLSDSGDILFVIHKSKKLDRIMIDTHSTCKGDTGIMYDAKLSLEPIASNLLNVGLQKYD